MDENQKFLEINSSFEKRDLEDFEFLEQLANDDVSFLSSLSTVEKVLEKHHFIKSDFDNNNFELENNNEPNLGKMSADTNVSSNTLKDDFSNENSDCESWSSQKSNEESDNSTKVDHASKTNDLDNEKNQENDESYISSENNKDLKKISNTEQLNNVEKTSPSIKLKNDVFENSSKLQTEEFLTNLAQKLFPGIKEGSYDESISTHNIEKYSDKEFEGKNQSKIPKAAVSTNQPQFNNNTNIGKVDKTSASVEIDNNLCNNFDKDILQKKLNELGEETVKFKKDNKVLEQLKADNESYLKLLKKELAEFEMKKKLDKDDFEKYKTNEIQKLKKDRKIFENYKLGQEKNFNRESRNEIDALKSELEKMKRALKEKEKKHQMAMERMKSRVDALEADNDKLKDDLLLRERDRSELLKQVEELEVSKLKINPTNPLKAYDKYTPDNTDDVYKFKSSNHLDNLKERLSYDEHSTSSKKFDNKKIEKASFTSYKYNTVEITDRSLLSDGSSLITYSNGTTKTTRPNGHNTTKYFNGDTKDSYPDGKTTYYYANSKTKHYTFPDGSEIYYFHNGQSEKHYPVGTREITFPDGTIKFIDPNNDCEETIFPDGSVLKTYSNGKTEMEFANGEKEVHNKTYRRRDYPDGTSKTIFNDGIQQTTYPSGRVRIKDALGCVIFDGIK